MKTIVTREPVARDVYIHAHGYFVDVRFMPSHRDPRSTQLRATVKKSPHAKSFANKLVFWCQIEWRWDLARLLQFVAEEHENAVYAARRRVRGRIFG